jgi:hypothetical protein
MRRNFEPHEHNLANATNTERGVTTKYGFTMLAFKAPRAMTSIERASSDSSAWTSTALLSHSSYADFDFGFTEASTVDRDTAYSFAKTLMLLPR